MIWTILDLVIGILIKLPTFLLTKYSCCFFFLSSNICGEIVIHTQSMNLSSLRGCCLFPASNLQREKSRFQSSWVRKAQRSNLNPKLRCAPVAAASLADFSLLTLMSWHKNLSRTPQKVALPRLNV